MTHEDRIWGKLTESKPDKYAAIAAGETFFRVCYLNNHGEWYPLWNIRDFETFEAADNVAKTIAAKLNGEYISLR